MRIIFFFLLFLLSVTPAVNAQLRLPAVISSGMVLQQNDSVLLWGWGNNGQKVTITNSWGNETAFTEVNNYAKWKVKIKTPAAGGPYIININHGGGTTDGGPARSGCRHDRGHRRRIGRLRTEPVSVR